MKETNVMYDIVTLEDCKNLNKDVKYVSIDIKNVNVDVISYLKNNGNNLFFSDRIGDKHGYVYVDYATFIKGESVIDNIVNNIPNDLSELEIARYLYVCLGKTVGYDINIAFDKNEFFSLNNINNTNNLWNCLSIGKTSNYVLAKIYLYLCSLFDINCEVIYNSDDAIISNKLNINDNIFVVSLGKDLALIQAGFPTKNFSSYNNEIDIDKRVGYIKKDYNDKLIDRALSSINYMDENMVDDILKKTQKILDLNKIKPVELGIIYNYIFNKYCPNYDIIISNLYINDKEHEHFILISYGNKYYSYNYNIKSFIQIDKDILVKNLDNNKVCLYNDEFIPNISKKTVTL